ncbi:hypothetical protein [Aeromicrobium sp.]|uniref:hypothetical protein n=1 Tax=Aeromicrobium sp. TaxID=1871063 RepID=UPI003D6B2483
MSDLDLVTDLAKKSGLVWIEFADRTFPVWHKLVEDAVCVVGGGAEQPIPDVHDGDTVTLLLRSKTNRHMVARVDATVELVTPEDPAWDSVTAALKSGRLNLPDMGTAIDRWARESRVLRLMPREPVLLAGDLPHDRSQTSPRLSG